MAMVRSLLTRQKPTTKLIQLPNECTTGLERSWNREIPIGCGVAVVLMSNKSGRCMMAHKKISVANLSLTGGQGQMLRLTFKQGMKKYTPKGKPRDCGLQQPPRV